VVDRGGPSGEREAQEGAGEAPTFEQARAELERIVGRLETGEADLEEAIALWERGEQLYRLCLAKLDAAQGRVELLRRDAARAPAEAAAGEAPPGEGC
jgi:exodeoxyribonuclease VII small subunit